MASIPVWLKSLFDEPHAPASRRLKLTEATHIPVSDKTVIKTIVEFQYRTSNGTTHTTKAKLCLLDNGGETVPAKSPLYYSAGYELDDATAVSMAANGYIVATPGAQTTNPLVHGINPDAVLLHFVRSLPIVDDSRVVITGGSAGGYMALMVAAETFPVSGVAPAVPPINFGYNIAYYQVNSKLDSRKAPGAPATPVFDIIIPVTDQALTVYGDDPNDQTFYRHSPLAHLETITCPVSVYWTTADMLVPIDQVGKEWCRTANAAIFPEGFRFDPDQLMTSEDGKRRVANLLDIHQYELFKFSETQIKEWIGSTKAIDLPFSSTKQWSITILDEGAPEPQVGHFKYAVPWSYAPFFAHVLSTPLSADQLTERKLQRLMDRYAGKEWLPTALVHLDELEFEQKDVLRGLRTYVRMGDEHRNRLRVMYHQLDNDYQRLPDSVKADLGILD